jgi:hypothetical protein
MSQSTMTSKFLGPRIDPGPQCYQLQGFGPVVRNGSCTHGHDSFDFTLEFEQSVFSIAPSALFLLAFPLRWLHLRSESRKTKKGGLLGFSKVVSEICSIVSIYLQFISLNK